MIRTRDFDVFVGAFLLGLISKDMAILGRSGDSKVREMKARSRVGMR